MSDPLEDAVPQSAAIPYRIKGGEPRILLISNRSGRKWIVPKGIVEEWQTPREAALAEAWEEAGVRGQIVGKSLGTYEYEKWDSICRVKVYVMQVVDELDEWPEADFRKRKWVGLDEAVDTITNRDLRKLIRAACAYMK